jgi:hypothetical protein
MGEFNPPELQERNDCTLKSMCLESLETFPLILPTKKKNAMPDCPQITKKKKVKLESSLDSTEIMKGIGIELDFKKKSLSLLDRFYSEKIKEIIVLYNDRL